MQTGSNRRLVVAAAVLLGASGLLGFAGLALGGGVALAAGRRWMRQNDVHPRVMAAQTWRQTREASRSAAEAWRAAAPTASR